VRAIKSSLKNFYTKLPKNLFLYLLNLEVDDEVQRAIKSSLKKSYTKLPKNYERKKIYKKYQSR